jgi:hypothetical protein
MRICRSFIILFFSLVIPVSIFAQDKKNFMRENGMIYVVVAVMITILAGLILYLVRLDKKMSRLEKVNKH